MSKPTGDSRALRTYARLDKEKRAAEAKLKKVKSEIEACEPRVKSFFEKMGVSKFTIEGITIYLNRQLWVGRQDDVSHNDVAAAMKKAGLSEYCGPRLNTQSFSAFVRELQGEGSDTPEELVKKLPAPLQGIIKISEVFKINTRKG